MKKSGLRSLLAVALLAGSTSAFAQQDYALQTGLNPSAVPPQTSALGNLYNAAGFEAFTNGTLAGQNSFTSIGSAPFAVGATTGVGGTKGVTASPVAAGTTYYYPTTTAYTPQAGEGISINTDFATSDPNLSTNDNTGFLIDVYSNAGRIGRFGLFIGTNTIRIGVTSRFNSTTGQFDPAGALTNVTLTGALTANTFYNLEARFNFTVRTFDLYSNGSLFYANIPFSSAAGTADTSFSDADLSSVGIASGSNTGAFDNYAVNVITVVPEPGTVALLAGAGLAGVVLRRRRR